MNVHRKTVSDICELSNPRIGLEAHVSGRIETLLQELGELPPAYTPVAYRKWLEIQDSLNGLYDIKRRFLCSPPPIESSVDKEELY